jgi:hypothetical protein
MPPTAAPWHRRFMDRLPPLPDWFGPILLLCGCVVLGCVLGMVVCGEKPAQRTQRVLQESMSILRLDTKVQHLEQRMQKREER